MADKWLVEIITERIKGGKPKDTDDSGKYTEAQCTTYNPRKDLRRWGGVKEQHKDTESICTAFGSSNEILRDPAKAGEETSYRNATGDCTERNHPIPASLTAPQIWINSGSSVE